MAGLSAEHVALVERLSRELTLNAPKFELLDRYFDGDQLLELLNLAVPPQLEHFTVITNWPRIAATATADRMEVKGFRYGGKDAGDDRLWEIWTANDMNTQDPMAILDYLVAGRGYKCIGTNENDLRNPLISVESPRQMITERDSRTRKVTAGLRYVPYQVVDGVVDEPDYATLYLPDETLWLRRDPFGVWELDADQGDNGRDAHGLGVVPVVPSFRQRRTMIPAHRRMQGVSAMADVIQLTDAHARVLTGTGLANELLSAPARGVIGASDSDFQGVDGKPLPKWAAYMGSVWALKNPNAKTFEFSAADMKNFTALGEYLARQAVAVTGLRPDYFGLPADDAASADAIRSREQRHVKSAENDQRILGAGDAEALRIALKFAGEKADGRIETLWYDAGTPTLGARFDAVVKAFTAQDPYGRPLMPAEMAYEELGWSPEKIKRAMALRDRDAVDPYLQAKDAADAAPPAA